MRIMSMIDLIGPWIVFIFLIAISTGLAYWLSDGFRGWRRIDGGNISFHMVFQTADGGAVWVPVNMTTGQPFAADGVNILPGYFPPSGQSI